MDHTLRNTGPVKKKWATKVIETQGKEFSSITIFYGANGTVLQRDYPMTDPEVEADRSADQEMHSTIREGNLCYSSRVGFWTGSDYCVLFPFLFSK